MIATLHHLSSTGGTLIARYLASLPDVAVVSEVNPAAGVPRGAFLPLDPVARLADASNLVSHAVMREEMVRRYRLCAELAATRGVTLVIREHSHSSFLLREHLPPKLVPLLREHVDANVKSAVTVRNPIDSWLSMARSKFNESLGGFADYCERYNAFLDHYAGLPIIRYEDFVADPSRQACTLCEALGLPFVDDFEALADVSLTGNSGRGRHLTGITRLRRRRLTRIDRAQLVMNSAGDRLFDRLGYDFDVSGAAGGGGASSAVS